MLTPTPSSICHLWQWYPQPEHSPNNHNWYLCWYDLLNYWNLIEMKSFSPIHGHRCAELGTVGLPCHERSAAFFSVATSQGTRGHARLRCRCFSCTYAAHDMHISLRIYHHMPDYEILRDDLMCIGWIGRTYKNNINILTYHIDFIDLSYWHQGFPIQGTDGVVQLQELHAVPQMQWRGLWGLNWHLFL